MALNSDILKTDCLAKLNAKIREKNPILAEYLANGYTPTLQELLDENAGEGLDWLLESIAEAVAESVVLHIQTAAVVNTAVTGTLTPPTAVAGTGVGTVS